jgi:hypothetical protein
LLKITFQDQLFNSYLSQTYRVSNETFGPTTDPLEALPFEGFIVSAWSPKGESVSLKENKELSWKLEVELKNKGLQFEKVIAVESTRAWVEDAFLIHNIKQITARARARKFKQPGFIKLSGNTATVFETNSLTKRSTTIGSIPRLLGCPAKAKGFDSKNYCSQHGYWTTSQALAALNQWRDNLTIVNSRLGCNLCNNATTHPNPFVQTAAPDHINTIKVTNRFSIAQWVRLVEKASE